jgi:hypothetical protein
MNRHYPKIVIDRTTVEIDNLSFGGTCEPSTSYTYHIKCNKWNLHHEMGHATAKILGIEQALGQMVWDTLGSEVTTNDNCFCYGAQCRERGDKRRAIAEYAADAIAAYIQCKRLPDNIRQFIDRAFRKT